MCRANLQDFLSKWPLKSLGPIGPTAGRDRVNPFLSIRGLTIVVRSFEKCKKQHVCREERETDRRGGEERHVDTEEKEETRTMT